MKLLKAVIILVGCCLVTGTTRFAHAAAPRILVYHEIVSSHLHVKNGAMVSLEKFTRHMLWLQRNGYKTLSYNDLRSHLIGGARVPSKSVMVMFDDGYKSVYERAFPILKALEMNFVVALIGARIGVTSSDGLSYLTRDEIIELHESGLATFVSHTYDGHERAPEWTCDEAADDLLHMDKWMESLGLEPARGFVYPYGKTSLELKSALRAHGMEMAFSTAPGPVSRGSDLWALPRYIVFPETDIRLLFR